MSLVSYDGKYELTKNQKADYGIWYIVNKSSNEKIQLPYPVFPEMWLKKSNGLLISDTKHLYLVDMKGNMKTIANGYINSVSEQQAILSPLPAPKPDERRQRGEPLHILQALPQ